MGEQIRTCTERKGKLAPIVIMDKFDRFGSETSQSLTYRLPDDRQAAWTGEFPNQGEVKG